MEMVRPPCATNTDYTLIWDERFVKPLQVSEPMDYTAPPPVQVDVVHQKDLNEVRRVVSAYSRTLCSI